jgi:hypothetical protein
MDEDCSESFSRVTLLQAERKGVSASEYGLVFGIFELVSFLSCPILGKYVSSKQLRRSLSLSVSQDMR